MPNQFYQSKEWKRLRAIVRQKWRVNDLPCAYCKGPIDWSVRRVAIADHLQPVKKRPDLALEESNIVMMHHACHTRKTYSVDLNKKEQIGADGFPVGSGWS